MIKLMVKVKHYLSLAVLAALLLLSTIGFAQQKSASKKARTNHEASDVNEAKGLNVKEKKTDDDEKGLNRRNFLIAANLIPKLHDVFNIPRTYSIACNNDMVYTIYNATIDDESWKSVCEFFSQNRFEQNVFLNNVLPKALVFGDDNQSAQNYVKALNTFIRNRPELIFMGPEFMKDFYNDTNIALKLYGMQIEQGNFIKSENIKLN